MENTKNLNLVVVEDLPCNLDHDSIMHMVAEEMEVFGTILDIRPVYGNDDSFTGKCFVSYETPEAAEAALAARSSVSKSESKKRPILQDKIFHAENIEIPDSISCVVKSVDPWGVLSIGFIKADKTIIYVKLYGPRISKNKRFAVMNLLDNYFHRYGKIYTIGRMKEKYKRFGDFFVCFDKLADALKCEAEHSAEPQTKYDLNPSKLLGLPNFKMTVA